ncbi:MAG: hypothetical protein J0M24_09900 [Verrucomicrobia bacterium]|nr:hypothetical protein [Verrucomicrobiota bacterium]
MSRILLCLTALILGLTGCSRPETPPELRWRFLGGRLLQLQTNAPALRTILTLPEAAALAQPLARQMAQAWWNFGQADGEPPPAALEAGAQLTQDLIQQLSIGEVVPASGGREFALAIQVDPARVAVWEKSWPAFISALRTARGGSAGGPPAVTRRDVWLLAVSDSTLFPAEATFRRLATYPPVPGALLQFDSAVKGRPGAQVAFTTTNGNVRLAATVTTVESVPATLPAWELPSFIREPLIQFTAARGLKPLTAGWLELDSLTGSNPINQLFIWGQPNVTMRFPFMAAQVDQPKALLDHLYQRFQNSFAPASPSPLYQGRLLQDTNRLVLLGGLPVAPVLQISEKETKPFVTFGVIPMIRTTNPPAPEMIQQMNQPNVLVYDFEFTSESVKQWNALLQLPELLEGRQGIVNFPGSRWLMTAGPKLGECVTVVTRSGDRTLEVVRKSPVGLSGLELTALTKWLDPLPPLRRQLTNSPARPKP